LCQRPIWDIEVEKIMHSPVLTIDSNKWLTDAIAMFEGCNVSHLAVVENGEKVGIIRAEWNAAYIQVYEDGS
jgi:signal-transduction protein with cAMP-binding, CBS, and nucleotidyltransferase domain